MMRRGYIAFITAVAACCCLSGPAAAGPSSWADEIAAALPTSALWARTWTALGQHFPGHVLSAAQKQAILVPLAASPDGGPGIFPMYEQGALAQLQSQLELLLSAAEAAAAVSEVRFFLRLV
jgi:hypothetical protein